MASITIPTGKKSYDICDEYGNIRGTISFIPGDLNLFNRLGELENFIENVKKEILELTKSKKSDVEIYQALLNYDKKIKEAINNTFLDDISSVVFGQCSVFNSINGISYLDTFLSSVLPVISKDMQTAQKASSVIANDYLAQVEE